MGKFTLLLLAFANLSIASVPKLELCVKQTTPKEGCLSENPARDMLIPGRKFAMVSSLKLNKDELMDLIVQGDEGSGGSSIYIFFQEKNGAYILKGKSFGFSVHVEQKTDAPAMLIVHSQAGVCRQHFERMEFENDKYASKASFLWKCLQEAEPKTQYVVDELIGAWNDSRLKAGYKGERRDVFSLIPEYQLGFVQVDEKLQLKMKD